MLVDVHAHLDYDNLKNLYEVVERAKEAGVVCIITNGLNKESNRKCLEIEKKYNIVKAALGFYPKDAIKTNVESEIEFIRKKKPFAIGEIGLDGTYGEFGKQKKTFNQFLDLAKEIRRPVIIHSRRAEEEVLEILKGYDLNVILHCFSGRKKLIEEAEKRGYYFSVPCNLVRSEHFKNLVKNISISQLLTETDAPFLSPISGRINEPINIKYTIDKISKIKMLEKSEVEKRLYMNFQKIFKKC